jgi:hypothetical protein
MITLPGILFSTFSLGCIVCLFKHRRNYMLRAWGWLALCSFPAVIVQNTKWVLGTPGMTIGLDDVCKTLPYSWYVLSCGQSVVNIFEENIEHWTGHRQSTMLDNWPVFFGLGLAQALVLSYFVARRLRAGATLKDSTVITIGVFMCINAILAASFNWAGT